MTRKKCKHNNRTIQEFQTKAYQILRIKICHDCEQIVVSTEEEKIVTLEQLQELIKQKIKE